MKLYSTRDIDRGISFLVEVNLDMNRVHMNFRHIHHHHDNGGRVLLRFQVSQVSTTFSFEQQHSNVLSPVVVSRRYLSISGKVISGRSRAAPYRSKNEQTSAKLGQSAGPELRTTTEAAIFPGGEKQEGRGCCQDATVCDRKE